MKRLVVVAGFAIALGLAGSACGSDAEALTKPEFIEQANAICQASFEEVEPHFDAIFADLDDWDDPAVQDLIFVRWAEAMDVIKPILDRQLDDIGALEPPAEDKELLETLMADQAQALDEFDRLMEAAADGDQEARAFIDEQDEDPFADVNRRAREYGLDVCGSEDG